MPKLDDKLGKTFGYFTVIKFGGIDKTKSKTQRTRWICKCICGKIENIASHSLKSGRATSCGCKTFHWSKEDGYSAATVLYNIYKQSAKKRNFSFTLNREEFVSFIYKNCSYCDSKPNNYIIVKGIKTGLFYNGIDRIDSNIGYELDNCITSCKHCNYAKRETTPEEFVKWLQKLYKNINKKSHPLNKYINRA